MVNHLRNKNSSPGTPGPVYAMARAVEIKTKTERSLRKKTGAPGKWKKKQIKELRKLVARVSDEIYRRKHWRKATAKEKRIAEKLKKKANSDLNKLKDLMIAK